MWLHQMMQQKDDYRLLKPFKSQSHKSSICTLAQSLSIKSQKDQHILCSYDWLFLKLVLLPKLPKKNPPKMQTNKQNHSKTCCDIVLFMWSWSTDSHTMLLVSIWLRKAPEPQAVHAGTGTRLPLACLLSFAVTHSSWNCSSAHWLPSPSSHTNSRHNAHREEAASARAALQHHPVGSTRKAVVSNIRTAGSPWCWGAVPPQLPDGERCSLCTSA